MAVTLNTIPTQTGEVVRALITSGDGGDNTTTRIWLDTRTASASGSVSADSDLLVAPSPGSLTRVLWAAAGEFRLIFISGGVVAAVADGGPLFGKHILLAFDDTSPAIDVDLAVADVSSTRNAQLRWNASAAEEALYDAVALGSLINFVISDAPSDEVFVDAAAALTAGAPTLTAVAELVPFLGTDTAAAFTAGAPTLAASAEKVRVFVTAAVITAGVPTLTASAEKVGLVQEFHDTAVAITAGAPVVAAVAELVEGGVFEVSAPLVAGAPSVVADAESVGLAEPFHDTEAALTAGSASVAVSAEQVGLANEFHDATAVIEAGPPSLAVLVELDEVEVIEVLASFVAGAPQVEAEAVAVALADAFTDVLVSLTAGAPSFSAGAELLSPSDRTGPLANSLTRGVVSIKRTLLNGGLLRSVQWLRRTGDKNVRGRQAVSISLLDVLIEQQPGLARSAITTDQSDDTVLTILDPVAIKDTDTFRWGGHTYKVKKIEGVIKNEVTGVRFSSEVTVIR